MASSEPLEAVVSVLTRRSELLEVTLDEPLEKPALVDVLNVSRSTVDRGLRELMTHGFVERVDDGFTATLAGRLAIDVYAEFISESATVNEAKHLLSCLPADVPITTDLLSSCTVYEATPPAAHGPVNHLEAQLRTANTHRGVTHTVSQASTLSWFLECIEDGLDAEKIHRAELLDYFHKDNREHMERMVATDNFRVLQVETVPFGLAITTHDDGTQVSVIIYNGNGSMEGVIANDTQAAYEWAMSYYESLREEAVDITDEFR
jgi:predicted transcriptional regulator